MNAELIDLYRGVQKYRGEWKKFDPCWHPNRGMGTITAIFREEACLEIEFPGGKLTYFHTKEPKDLLYLPPVWSDDGRCLTGMIEGNLTMGRKDDTWTVAVMNDKIIPEPVLVKWGVTLPEALLRAIKAQEVGE